MQIPTTWAKKLIKLDDIKNLRFKKGKWGLSGQLIVRYFIVEKEHKQVKIKGYAGTDGNFLSHAHYRDPYFDFIHLLTKLTSN